MLADFVSDLLCERLCEPERNCERLRDFDCETERNAERDLLLLCETERKRLLDSDLLSDFVIDRDKERDLNIERDCDLL